MRNPSNPQNLPPVTRDRPAEQRADRIARGERPAPASPKADTIIHQAAPAGLGLGPGVPLPAVERHYFEDRLRADLGPVRVHPNAEAAPSLGANAFAAGRDIGFAPGRWQPGTHAGRRLLGHELAHVLEQSRRGPPAVQLDEAPKPAEADQAADVLTEGIQTVVEQAKENEGVKSVFLDPAKRYALDQWNRLGSGEKAAVGGFGAGTYGLALGAGLADPAGRSGYHADSASLLPARRWRSGARRATPGADRHGRPNRAAGHHPPAGELPS